MKTPFRSPRLAAGILSALTLCCSAVSVAADNTDVPRVIVKFGDLNLANPLGAATLYRRITVAAHEVCKTLDPSNHGLGTAQQDLCIHKAIADAVTDVGHPELVAVYNSKNRRQLPILVARAQ
jgi:UrcA family protein